MTAEIVVMNRQGVALAADSAVTVGESKVLNTANKLFMLAPNHPVGILVYNAATFMNLPWEIFIKEYKDYILNSGIAFPKLEQYGEDFISFIKKNQERFVTVKQQEHIIADVVEEVFDEITKGIWESLEDITFSSSERVTPKQIETSTKQEIKKALDFFENYKDMYSADETKELEEMLFVNFGEVIKNSRDRLFDKVPLDKKDIQSLNKICLYLLSKDCLLSIHTGIVFVGYGKDDLLPACSAFLFECFICGKLKCRVDVDNTTKIDFSGASTGIVPLAQTDVTQTFMMGTHPMFLHLLDRKLKKEMKMSSEDTEKFVRSLMDEMFSNYGQSIYRAVNSLSKEDLAVVAETLVTMTSFMRKVSMALETVGGPVDVAVISKQDGFVWIKRKNYYDSNNNPHLLRQ